MVEEVAEEGNVKKYYVVDPSTDFVLDDDG